VGGGINSLAAHGRLSGWLPTPSLGYNGGMKMNRVLFWLYAMVYCAAYAVIGIIVGSIGGTAIASLLMKPEEAVVLVNGILFGAPVGALAGLALAVNAIRKDPNRR